MIHGLRHLINLRRRGQRPAFLEVDVDCPFLEPTYAADFENMVLVAEGDLLLDDFRPFVGLDVVVFAPQTSKTFSYLIERMQEYAATMRVFCCEYGLDLGWEWSKKWGQCEIGETYWAEQWDAARTMVCRTKQETEERLRLEREALAHCPWITERYAHGKAVV